MADETDRPGETALTETPGRVLTFLLGMGKRTEVRALLQKRGYTPSAHARGWDLLRALDGFPGAASAPVKAIDTAVADAIEKVDAWDEPNFLLIDAALEGDFPAQNAFVFEGGLKASRGPSAVLGVDRCLTRLDALEKSPDRKGSRKQDHAALAKLVERGITPDERARMRALVDIAMKGVEIADAEHASPEASAQNDERVVALWRWHREWSKTARAVLTRRDHLIALGLAERRSPKKKAKAPTP